MTSQEINHIKACKNLLIESASKIDAYIQFMEYKEGSNNVLEIYVLNEKGFYIYQSFNVSCVLGFIDGVLYQLKTT